ncbi:MAG: hypothetical protein JEY99_08645 [Spirochaetales bacterium]|nr:hypothetical protein [Spirochaetales bacterium]
MNLNWKQNWPETRQHFLDWWKGEGFIISHWGSGFNTGKSLYGIADPGLPVSHEQRHSDEDWVVRSEEYRLSCNYQGGDFLPLVFPDYGTVTLSTFMGVGMRYEEEYILYHPTDLSPENDRKLTFDLENDRFKAMMNICRKLKNSSLDRYAVGFPALPPGLDVLAEVRGTQNLLLDLIMNPEWVKEKLQEINTAYFEYYEQFYQLLKGKDESSLYGWFMLWGPGRVSLAQCDFCAMISPDMFREFEIPVLREHCNHMDHTLFHLDGPTALDKLDALLEVENLDAIEYTPGPQVPQGGDQGYYDMYRKIKAAGKSVQAVEMRADEVIPLMDAVGPEGMYLMINFQNMNEVESVLKSVEQYR